MNFRGLFVLSPILVAASVTDENQQHRDLIQELIAKVDDFASKVEEQAAEIKILKSVVQDGIPSADGGSNSRRLSAKSSKFPKQEQTCSFTESQCNGDVFNTTQICEAFATTGRSPSVLNCTTGATIPEAKPLLKVDKVLTPGNNYTGCDGDLFIYYGSGLPKYHINNAIVARELQNLAARDHLDCADECQRDPLCKYALWNGSTVGGTCLMFHGDNTHEYFDKDCGFSAENCVRSISQVLWAKCDAAP